MRYRGNGKSSFSKWRQCCVATAHFEKDDLPKPQQAVCHLFMALVNTDKKNLQRNLSSFMILRLLIRSEYGSESDGTSYRSGWLG